MILGLREFLDPALIFVSLHGLCATVLTARLVRAPYQTRESSDAAEVRQLLATLLICCLLSAGIGGNLGGALLATALATIFAAGLRIWLPQLTMVGAMALATMPLALIIGAPWSFALMHESGAGFWLLALSAIGTALGAVSLAFVFAENLVRQALFTHQRWRRPYRMMPRSGGSTPRVSIQLPCYAEPPEIVIATLDRLARLDYPNFEVLVCDNNTADPALWRPLEAHCERLNRDAPGRFRFFHVDPLPGAKAGALNWLMDVMDPDATLVAVIDADYHARPDFLSRLAGFFDDPAIGYVQTPHDYRGWQGSPFLKACYWEYMPNNKVELAGLNEYGAAFTIGTMCVIRTEALERAGRWAEWCLTEDSEVSVRLRAHGYQGIYLRDTFGRGLIPETFSDYRKQRFRWTAGPVQQLRRHWRFYLPGTLGTLSQLDSWSRLLEFQRGIAPVLHVVTTLFGLFITALVALVARTGDFPVIDLPLAAWITMATGWIGWAIAGWQRYRFSGCVKLRDMMLGELARLSLCFVQMQAGIAGLSAKPLAWRRTPKFQARGSGMRAIVETLPETLIGIGHLALVAAVLATSEYLGSDITLLAALGGTASGLRFFAAPAMAFLSERHLSRLAAATKGVAAPVVATAGG